MNTKLSAIFLTLLSVLSTAGCSPETTPADSSDKSSSIQNSNNSPSAPISETMDYRVAMIEEIQADIAAKEEIVKVESAKLPSLKKELQKQSIKLTKLNERLAEARFVEDSDEITDIKREMLRISKNEPNYEILIMQVEERIDRANDSVRRYEKKLTKWEELAKIEGVSFSDWQDQYSYVAGVSYAEATNEILRKWKLDSGVALNSDILRDSVEAYWNKEFTISDEALEASFNVLKIKLENSTISSDELLEEDAADKIAPRFREEISSAAKAEFESDLDAIAFAYGAYSANTWLNDIVEMGEYGVNLDDEVVFAGIKDALDAKVPVARTIMWDLNEEKASVWKRISEQHFEEIAKQNKEAGKSYRDNFEQGANVGKSFTGLLYQVITPSEGRTPTISDTVEVHYKGSLIDGTQFDSSYDRNQTATFPLRNVIPGWSEGLQLMPVGSKFRFVIPPELAYGESRSNDIPANSTLVFEVELIGIH
ncbi:FKBP-type peptidyl-prolyl cis-trans isomerase [Vibrio mexicanus]|uniref:FKBP-type peptidyl-prolyl cis-trans isomerase n=1 Tax=Vibrio mexicanus TaxID=1004326 RepID=UPI00069B45D2|nr:FKBP-type peptidyl-prolyl cis-trans isomerase [Vibrio mexicanus]